jgi:hypothetical protein
VTYKTVKILFLAAGYPPTIKPRRLVGTQIGGYEEGVSQRRTPQNKPPAFAHFRCTFWKCSTLSHRPFRQAHSPLGSPGRVVLLILSTSLGWPPDSWVYRGSLLGRLSSAHCI